VALNKLRGNHFHGIVVNRRASVGGDVTVAYSEVQLSLIIAEEDADEQRLDELTTQLMYGLQDLDLIAVERPSSTNAVKGIKGDPLTWGVLILVILPSVLPALVEFLSTWVVERRKVVVKAPNGAELEFIPDKRYTRAELLALVEEINRFPVPNGNCTECDNE
jgi:hypothetical protein